MHTPSSPADPALARLLDQVRTACAERTPLNLCGGNTKAFYGEPQQGRTLDLRVLHGISSYEPTELVVTVRAGTPLVELEAALAERGQFLPFEPPRFSAAGHDGTAGDAPGGRASGTDGTGNTDNTTGSAVGGTVGGMVAAGLAGPARAAVGGVRDYVLGASLIDGRGQLLSFGGQVMKNVAGYDVARLLVGSLGTLGVIAEVSLKVLPLPPACRTLRFELDEAEALLQINRWSGQPLPINASAWWQGMLVLRLAGAAAAVDAAERRLLAQRPGAAERVDDALAQAFWRGLRDQRDEFFTAAERAVAQGATLWRLSVPATTPATALPGEHLVEWGGAQRWVVTSAGPTTVRELAARMGGHATAYRGPKDRARTGGVFTAPGPALQAIHQRLKAEFDPQGIFNPGRLYPEW